MANRGKKYTKARELLGEKNYLSISDAVKKIKELSFCKFNESVDVDINLGIDASKGDQVVRGAVSLPHGTGRKSVVLVFAKGDYATKAEAAGADFVGADELVEKISGGWLDFDYAVATPDLMGLVGKVAKILGPKGLLPNAKNGTVTFEVAKIVNDIKKGQVFFKNDKAGLVHTSIGKTSFAPEALEENLRALLKSVLASKPSSAKGKFLKKVTVTSTMGQGIPVILEESLRV